MTRYALVALFALPACFNPTSGDYLFEEGESSSDCPESDTGGEGEAEDTTIAVEVNEDKTTMTIGEGDGAYDCALDGKNFTCPFDPLVIDMADYGDFDAKSTTTFDISGSWTSSTSFDMTTAFDTVCEGADCESMGLVSCSGTGSGSASLQE